MKARANKLRGRWSVRQWAIFAGLAAAIFFPGVLWAHRVAKGPQAQELSSPTPTPRAAARQASNTLEPTPTPTLTPSATPSPTPTPSSTPSHTPTTTPTPTSSCTPSPSPTPLPQPTPDGTARTLRVPILMYHYISTPPPDADAIRHDLSVAPGLFEEHLRYLRDAGYASITLGDLTLALQTGYPLPPKPVIITLDDGYRDAYTEAFPLLRRYGFTATFFLITSLIDAGHPDYLTWDQVTEMSAAGMDMEAHGYSHVDLRDRDDAYIIWQVLGAKEAIEARTHKAVRFFCYPSGKYDGRVAHILHSAHYWGAVTTQHGVLQCSECPFELRRIRVRGTYQAEDLARVMEAALSADEEGTCTTTP